MIRAYFGYISVFMTALIIFFFSSYSEYDDKSLFGLFIVACVVIISGVWVFELVPNKFNKMLLVIESNSKISKFRPLVIGIIYGLLTLFVCYAISCYKSIMISFYVFCLAPLLLVPIIYFYYLKVEKKMGSNITVKAK